MSGLHSIFRTLVGRILRIFSIRRAVGSTDRDREPKRDDDGRTKDNLEFYNRVRNRVGRLDKTALLLLLIRRIHDFDVDQEKVYFKYHLWNLLFLCKMAALHGAHRPGTTVAEWDLQLLLNDCIALNNFVPDVGETDSGSNMSGKVFRTVANQQFWLQHPVNLQNIVRPLLILKRSKEVFRVELADGRLVSADSFVKHLYIVHVWLKSHPGRIAFLPEDAEIIAADPSEFRAVVDFLTVDIHDIPRLLNEISAIKSQRLAIFEQSLFFKFPFWRIGSEVYAVSDRILERTITRFMLDAFSKQPAETRNSLSEAFERYVEDILKSVGIPIETEGEIRWQVGHEGKVVDFIIPGRTPVFIECKFMFAPQIAKVYPPRSVLINSFQETVIKGFAQGFSAFALTKGRWKCPPFLLIVTSDELHFGDSPPLWNEFVADGLRKHYPECPVDSPPFGVDRVFVLSIQDLETLIAYSYARRISIARILAKAVKDFAKRGHGYLSFQGMLDKLLGGGKDLLPVPMIKAEFDEMTSTVLSDARRRLDDRSRAAGSPRRD